MVDLSAVAGVIGVDGDPAVVDVHAVTGIHALALVHAVADVNAVAGVSAVHSPTVAGVPAS